MPTSRVNSRWFSVSRLGEDGSKPVDVSANELRRTAGDSAYKRDFRGAAGRRRWDEDAGVSDRIALDSRQWDSIVGSLDLGPRFTALLPGENCDTVRLALLDLRPAIAETQEFVTGARDVNCARSVARIDAVVAVAD